MASDELMTAREVADTFRVSPGTVTRWAREGKVEAVRLPGRTIRYRRADVEAMLATGSTPAEVA